MRYAWMERDRGRGRPGWELTTEGNADQQEQSWYDQSHEELVSIVRGSMVEAREAWEKEHGEGTFDPVMWIGRKLTDRYIDTGYDYDYDRKERQERQEKALRQSLAWDAISEPYLKNEH